MFLELAFRDAILIRSFVFLLGACFFSIFVMVTKTLPTGSGSLRLGKRGVIITLGIHLFIIFLCTVIFIFRVTTINNFVYNGIKKTAYIQNVIKEKEKLRFSYMYKIGEEIFFDSAEIYDKKEFSDFIIGAKIFILVDPNDIRKSLFSRLIR
jgi:apolipoprotein N-acyltransferase